MLTKDQHCLETILEAIDRIIEYTSGFNSADDFNNPVNCLKYSF